MGLCIRRMLGRYGLFGEAKPALEPRYYSHVLHFPARKPFDREELRWSSFIGEFVAPLALGSPEMLYWFSDYTLCARFRVFTANYEGLRTRLEALRDKLGLQDDGTEKELTLENDLGVGRFWGPDSKVTRSARAKTLLRSLKAGADLMIESVIQRSDGYWEFEGNGDPGLNPISNHRFSVVHLFHNMMNSKARVFAFQDAQGRLDLLSQYYFADAMNRKIISPVAAKPYDILM
jgi:hypothetical protein